MFTYTLRIGRNGKATYGPGWPFRILNGFFAVLLTYALYSVLREEGFEPLLLVPIFVILLLYFAALYRDEWVFDNQKREAVCIFGIGPVARRRRFSYDDIRRLEITHFLKGIPDGSEVATKASWRHPSQIVLSVVMNDEDSTRYDMEITKEKSNGQKLQREASRLAAYTELDIHMDRESYNTRHLY